MHVRCNWSDPQAAVWATDVSFDALQVACRNAERLQAPVRFEAGDLLAGLSGPFDLIVSNPPYVTEAEFADLMPGVRDYEPRLALVACLSGLERTGGWRWWRSKRCGLAARSWWRWARAGRRGRRFVHPPGSGGGSGEFRPGGLAPCDEREASMKEDEINEQLQRLRPTVGGAGTRSA